MRRMSAFEIWVRWGRIIKEPEPIETKFNPWHDPENGRFTFAGGGNYFSGGTASGSGGAPPTGGSATRGEGARNQHASSGSVAQHQTTPPPRSRQAPTPKDIRSSSPVSLLSTKTPKTSVGSAAVPKAPSANVKPANTANVSKGPTGTAHNAPTAQQDLVQKFKQHMIPYEGDRNNVYPDNVGKPTVGIGHLVVPSDGLKMGDRISDAQKDAFWRQDSAKALAAAEKQMAEAGITDPDFIFSLASVNFQLGSDWIKDFKKTWAFILNGDYEDAAREAQDSDWFKQTPVRVRAFQRALLALPPKPAN